MIHEKLFRLEREAEQRVHEARDREIDRGGPGSTRRASAAMDAPMLEVAAIRKMRQRFGDLQMEIDHHDNLLRRTTRNPDLPSDVKRHRIREAETKLARLTADYGALEAEAERSFFPASARSAEPRVYHRDGVWLPARPEREPRAAERPGLPATPRPKPETAPEFPVPRPRPDSQNMGSTPPVRPLPRPDHPPVPDYATEPERSSPDARAQDRFPDKWAAKGWGGPRGPYGVPTLNDERDRIENILADKPARFEIEVVARRDESKPLSEIHILGATAVRQYDSIIEKESLRQGVDPDLVRAIIYVENAQGQLKDYFGSFIRKPTSVLPMNINPNIWGGLVGPDEDFSDPATNVRAGVTLIKRIADRIDAPTVDEIASVWNFTGSETGTDLGARVGEVYKRRPWSGGDMTNPPGPYGP